MVREVAGSTDPSLMTDYCAASGHLGGDFEDFGI